VKINILITGGSGFIGKRLVKALVKKGHAITVISRKGQVEFSKNVKVIKADLMSEDCHFEQIVENSDVIFHCAGDIHNKEVMRRLHVDGTQYLLNAVINRARKIKKVIHWVQLSSVGVYGPPEGKTNKQRVVTENSAINPQGEYEVTKAIADELLIKASDTEWLTYSILRPSIVFGEAMPNTSLSSLGWMVAKKMFFYIGEPGAVSTYIHVDDVINSLIQCSTDFRAKNKVFNISNDCSQEELINSIAYAYSVPVPKIRIPELLIRPIVSILPSFIPCPLTESRIDALVNRTYYPYTLIENTLGISPKESVPRTIKKVALKEWGKK